MSNFVQQPEAITELGSASTEIPEERSEILNGSDEFIQHPSHKQGPPKRDTSESNSPPQEPKSVVETTEILNVNNETDTVKPDIPVSKGADTLTTLAGEIEASANERYKEQIGQIY
ncbi:MAG: hypothetical protein ABIA11_02270 [Patescibacteria group bacterium]